MWGMLVLWRCSLCGHENDDATEFAKAVVLGGLRMPVVICLILGEMSFGMMTKDSCDNEEFSLIKIKPRIIVSKNF
jgi:hypothetical protein